LPAGILRESPSEMKRADCVVITRADDSKRTEELRREIAAQTSGSPIFSSRMKLSAVRAVRGAIGQPLVDREQIRASRISAFCGLGNPESFFSLLRRSGYELAHTKVFRDHHLYTQSDVDRVVRESVARGAQILLTTAKDEVKLRSLRFELPCYGADITIEIDNAEQLKDVITEAATVRV
jgi:tetraacyldisaccharide 4'-kinase